MDEYVGLDHELGVGFELQVALTQSVHAVPLCPTTYRPVRVALNPLPVQPVGAPDEPAESTQMEDPLKLEPKA